MIRDATWHRAGRIVAWRELRNRLAELEPDEHMNAEWRAMLWRRVAACIADIKEADEALEQLRAEHEHTEEEMQDVP